MKIRALLAVIAVFLIGAGVKLAYDGYQEDERQKVSEALSAPASCSTCDLHKADLQRLREENARHSRLEEPADSHDK